MSESEGLKRFKESTPIAPPKDSPERARYEEEREKMIQEREKREAEEKKKSLKVQIELAQRLSPGRYEVKFSNGSVFRMAFDKETNSYIGAEMSPEGEWSMILQKTGKREGKPMTFFSFEDFKNRTLDLVNGIEKSSSRNGSSAEDFLSGKSDR